MSECWLLKSCSVDRRCFIFRGALTAEPCQPVSSEAELTGAEATGWSRQKRHAARVPGQLWKVPVAVANHRQINPRGCTESCTGREASKGRALCSPFGGSSQFSASERVQNILGYYFHLLLPFSQFLLFPFSFSSLTPIMPSLLPFCSGHLLLWPAYHPFTLFLLRAPQFTLGDQPSPTLRPRGLGGVGSSLSSRGDVKPTPHNLPPAMVVSSQMCVESQFGPENRTRTYSETYRKGKALMFFSIALEL